MGGVLQINSLTSDSSLLTLRPNSPADPDPGLSNTVKEVPDFSRIKLLGAALENLVVNYSDEQGDIKHQLALSIVSFNSNSALNNLSMNIHGAFNDLPITLSIETMKVPSDPSSQVSVNELPIALNGRIGKIDLESHGILSLSSTSMQLHGNTSVHIDNLTDIGELINIELPSIGPITLSASVNANSATLNSSGIDLSMISLQVDDHNLTLDAQGAFSFVQQSSAGELEINLAAPDLNWVLDLAGIKKQLPGSVKVGATLRQTNNNWHVDIHQATLIGKLIDLELAGNIEDLLGIKKALLNIAVNTPNLDIIEQLYGKKMPKEWGPITASGTLHGSDGNYSILEIEAKLNGLSKLTAKGSIASLVPFDHMQLDVEAHLHSLDEISTFTRKPLPDIGPFIGKGVVSWRQKHLTLTDARANYNGPHGIAAVTGNIGDLVHFDKVRLRADADLPSFSALDLFTGFTMPPVDNVVASANLISTHAKDLSAKNLKVTVKRDAISISGEGSVDSIIKSKAILDLKLKSRVESLDLLDNIVGRKFPAIGPVTATAKLVGSKKNIEITDLEAKLDDEYLTAVVQTDIGFLNRIEKIPLNVLLKTPSAKHALSKFGISTTVTKPASLKTEVVINLRDDIINIDNALLKINENTLNGNLSLVNYINRLQRTLIKGEIIVVDWNVLDILDQPLGINHTPQLQEGTKASVTILSKKPWALSLVARDDIDINVKIEQFTSTLLQIRDAYLEFRSEQGFLTLGPFAGLVNQGKAKFKAMVDTTLYPPAISITASADKIDLSQAGFLEASDLFENAGGTYARLNLVGRGNSVAEFMSTVNGEGGLYIEDILFKQGALRIFSSDIIDQLVNTINPNKESKQQTRFKCSALTFQIEDGFLETPYGFAIESDDFSIVGSANTNFKNETIKIDINSKPKRGLGLSLNKLANLIKIEGQLGSPKLSLSETGLLKFSASIAAAIASSGATLLAEGLWEKRQAKSDVCEMALGL